MKTLKCELINKPEHDIGADRLYPRCDICGKFININSKEIVKEFEHVDDSFESLYPDAGEWHYAHKKCKEKL